MLYFLFEAMWCRKWLTQCQVKSGRTFPSQWSCTVLRLVWFVCLVWVVSMHNSIFADAKFTWRHDVKGLVQVWCQEKKFVHFEWWALDSDEWPKHFNHQWQPHHHFTWYVFAKQCLIIDVSKPGHLRGLSKFGGVCLSSAMSVLPSDRKLC